MKIYVSSSFPYLKFQNKIKVCFTILLISCILFDFLGRAECASHMELVYARAAEINAVFQMQQPPFHFFNLQHMSFPQAVAAVSVDSPTNLSNRHSVSAMINTTPITAHNSSRPSSPPPPPPIVTRSQSPKRYNAYAASGHSYERKILKRRIEEEQEEEQERKRFKITQTAQTIPFMYDRGIEADERGNRKRSPSIEEQPQFLKKICVTPPVIRSNHTEVERCSP